MIRLTRSVSISLFALVALGLPAGAQRIEEPPDAVRYSLADCLRIALEQNLDLVTARKDPQIAEQRIDLNKSVFDPVFGASADFNRDSQDQTITNRDPISGATVSSEAGSSDEDLLTGGVSWSQRLGFGGSYDITLGGSDFDSTSREISQITGFFQDTDVESTGESLTIGYNMPLLNGLGTEVNKIDVLLARSGLEISKEDLRQSAILTIKAVEDAYWDLLATRAALGVARESLKLAEDLYELNKKKVEVGTLAPIDVTQAEAGVAAREEGVIVAEAAVGDAEDNLRRLLAIPQGDPAWSKPLAPTDRPEFEARPVDVEAALATALERRPEMAAARQRLRDGELSERVARKGVRHSLDFDAEFTPSRSDTDFRLSILAIPPMPVADSTSDTDGTDWRVGLTYSVPIGNRQAKANYAIARLSREKNELGLASVEQDIRVDVRVAARNVESGVKRVAAARSNTVLQRKTLEAEQKKYENGMSTSFEVLRIQTDLSDAQLAEIRAILDYVKGLADLERAKGTLLEARGLTLEP